MFQVASSFVVTTAWLLVELSGLSFLSLCSDVMLFLIVLLFLQANFTVFRHEKLQKLPKLVLSEEMVNNVAASFRLKVNHALLMAHDITFGKDFRLFLQGIILSITVSALYNKYQEHVDLFAGQIRQRVRNYYNLVDESVISRIRRTVAM
ncbi:hypothetical protein RHMOL_Rhmol03G0175300 [Rhododendron molle]|uniref:Uncharacterized protein n=1 Tax=Rhododendron molle TaxID=49168 RepID=A0ACC0PGX3_RHOML|nr:hypothetical protein RHMOL_Rhmol03G0175300 [Rhododendron molle]